MSEGYLRSLLMARHERGGWGLAPTGLILLAERLFIARFERLEQGELLRGIRPVGLAGVGKIKAQDGLPLCVIKADKHVDGIVVSRRFGKAYLGNGVEVGVNMPAAILDRGPRVGKLDLPNLLVQKQLADRPVTSDRTDQRGRARQVFE